MNALSTTDRSLIAEITDAKPSLFQWLVEKSIFLVAGSVILIVAMIFTFVAWAAVPVVAGQVSTARSAETLAPDTAVGLPKPQLAGYLVRPLSEIENLDDDTLKILIELRNEELTKLDNKDSGVNTASWPMMLLPFQWSEYNRPEYIWQPNSVIPKYNFVPLLAGSFKVSLLAIAIALPIGIAAAFYVSQIAPPAIRETVKPVIELLAGFPSVVLGFFGLIVLATVLQNLFHTQLRLNSLVAASCVALAVIPILFTIAEDALSAVPKLSKDAALAMGASNWYASATIVFPAALPGIFAAVMLAFGRALGETMIALMCSGNASVMGLNIFESARTIPATIGQELAEAPFGSIHYRVLFLIGTILFLLCFLLNVVGDFVIHRLKNRLEGAMSPEEYESLAIRRSASTVV